MFGRMMVEPIVQVKPGVSLQTAITALTPDSGAVYVLDRTHGTWYAVDFDDEQFGGYSVTCLESLLNECKFLDLIKRPGLWRTGLPWVVAPGIAPEAAV